MMQVVQSLGRLEGKIDKALDNDADFVKTTDDHEDRIRKLEQTGWKQTGVVLGVSAVVSALIAQSHKLGALLQ